MNIVFAIDQNYITHCAATIQSILCHHADTPLQFYILIDQISQEKKDKLERAFHRPSVHLHFIPIQSQLFTDFLTRDHLSRAVYYRLLIPELIPTAKVLYLDADTIVNGSILEFYNTELAAYMLAGVENYPSAYQNRQAQQPPGCFNSGVLLLNLDECRRVDLKSLAMNYIKTRRVCDDQPILNGIIGTSWKVMPPKYNFTSSYLRFIRQQEEPLSPELQEAFTHPVIIHYTSANKPWLFFSNHHYRNLYWKYLKMTPFYHPFNRDIIADNLRLTRYLIRRKIRGHDRE